MWKRFYDKTEVTSVKLVVFKWEKSFDILTEVPGEKLTIETEH